MTKRKAISKKTRFEVFKRDNFTCQYCGKTPPDVMLEIDHLKPVSKNGSDNINNLITACFDCNRGKSNIEINRIPNSLQENYEILHERQEQLKEYQKIIAAIERNYVKNIERVNTIFNDWFADQGLTDKFKRTTVKLFLKKLPHNKVFDAMDIACSKIHKPDQAIKYFCGICWTIIKGGAI